MHRNQSKRTFTFVAAVNNREVLENNLLASSCLREPHGHQILIQEGFNSAGKAYNDAIDKSRNDIIVFLHQDMILPDAWLEQLENALNVLESEDPDWGVLGCFGKTQNKEGRGYVYQSGIGIIGAPFERPSRIQTLDEIVLILRKSSPLRFDETLPHFHLYGTDLCMQAEAMGRNNYAIPAFCIHNSSQGFVLPKEFYQCYWHVRRAWSKRLPIQAPCIRITRTNFSMYKRRLYEIYYRYRFPKAREGHRIQNVRELVKEANQSLRQEATTRFAV